MTVFFISDPHLRHEKVAEIRGFDDVLDHDEAVLASFRPLRADDQLWVLGDLAVTSSPDKLLLVLGLLRGACRAQMHLIPGNHDPVHPMNRDAHRHVEMYRRTFASVQPFARRKVAGQSVLLSHFPYDGEGHRGGPGRHMQYRLRDEGVPLIHGHTHDEWSRSLSAAGTLQMNVGWDFMREPVSIDQLTALMATHTG